MGRVPVVSLAAVLAGGALSARQTEYRWRWRDDCLTFYLVRGVHHLPLTGYCLWGRGQTGIGRQYPQSVGITWLGRWTR